MFDSSKFLSTPFKPRTETVRIPQLKEFFAEGLDPTWTVRGLEAQELATVRLARFKRRNQLAALNTLSSFSASTSARQAMLEKIISMSGEVEAEVAGRLEMLCIASVEPKISMDIAVKLSQIYPTVFWSLTDMVTTLTDQGAVVGE